VRGFGQEMQGRQGPPGASKNSACWRSFSARATAFGATGTTTSTGSMRSGGNGLSSTLRRSVSTASSRCSAMARP
jgi:hypothetical protein